MSLVFVFDFFGLKKIEASKTKQNKNPQLHSTVKWTVKSTDKG